MLTVFSWNTQGDAKKKMGIETVNLFSSGNGNILMLQEAGNQGADGCKPDKWVFKNTTKYHEFTAYFYEHDGCLNSRCTTGMLVESGFLDVDVNTVNGICPRPVILCKCSYTHPRTQKKRYFVFATVHLTAERHAAEKELNALYDYLTDNHNEENWLVMGDFNCPVDRFTPPAGMNLKSPTAMTHQSGNTLDYVMCSASLYEYITVSIASDKDCMVPFTSDHFPIKCVIKDEFFLS